MEGEEERSETEGSFSKASIPKRIAIVVAGGMVNIIFGLIVYFMLIATSGNNTSNVVDTLVQDYSAQVVGIQSGDEILRINNKKIRIKSDIDRILQNSNGENLTVQIKRNDQIQNIDVIPTEVKVKSTGIYLSTSGKNEKQTQIINIDSGSSAEKSGLQINDIILKINGESVENSGQKVIEIISQKGIGTMLFTVQREGKEITLEVTPDYISKYFLGVNLKQAENNFTNNIYYGFWKTVEFSSSILENLKMLFTGRVGVDQMMGPVGISSVVSKTEGIKDFVYILALISLSLGVTNLLPIPALDGGKIVILLLEAIRRKPLKENVEIGIQMLGFAVLIGFSIFITYKDILRIF